MSQFNSFSNKDTIRTERDAQNKPAAKKAQVKSKQNRQQERAK